MEINRLFHLHWDWMACSSSKYEQSHRYSNVLNHGTNLFLWICFKCLDIPIPNILLSDAYLWICILFIYFYFSYFFSWTLPPTYAPRVAFSPLDNKVMDIPYIVVYGGGIFTLGASVLPPQKKNGGRKQQQQQRSINTYGFSLLIGFLLHLFFNFWFRNIPLFLPFLVYS